MARRNTNTDNIGEAVDVVEETAVEESAPETEVVEETTPEIKAADKEASKTEAPKKTAPKKVKIKLPLTRSEKDDVYVAVNGKSYLIKRGECVEVPASVAEVLRHKEEMLAQAMEFEAQAAANAEQ